MLDIAFNQSVELDAAGDVTSVHINVLGNKGKFRKRCKSKNPRSDFITAVNFSDGSSCSVCKLEPSEVLQWVKDFSGDKLFNDMPIIIEEDVIGSDSFTNELLPLSEKIVSLFSWKGKEAEVARARKDMAGGRKLRLQGMHFTG